VELYIHSPSTPSWHRTQLKAQEQIYLYLTLPHLATNTCEALPQALLTSALMHISGQLHASAALAPLKKPTLPSDMRLVKLQVRYRHRHRYRYRYGGVDGKDPCPCRESNISRLVILLTDIFWLIFSSHNTLKITYKYVQSELSSFQLQLQK
jgi:hypothetical protein